MRRSSGFQAFASGSCLFVAGIFVATAFESPGPWTRSDTIDVSLAALLLLSGVIFLYALYRLPKAI